MNLRVDALYIYVRMHLHVCTVQLYAHTWTLCMYMYIVYMQVLDRSLVVTDLIYVCNHRCVLYNITVYTMDVQVCLCVCRLNNSTY